MNVCSHFIITFLEVKSKILWLEGDRTQQIKFFCKVTKVLQNSTNIFTGLRQESSYWIEARKDGWDY